MKRPALAAAVLLAVASGCARDGGRAELPHACAPPDAAPFVRALAAAPDPVRLDGVALSECLPKRAEAAEVQVVGSLLLETAQRLAEADHPVALGYLVGALRRGAEGSPGLHLEIVRRVEQEAAPFEDEPGFVRGERAGRTSG